MFMFAYKNTPDASLETSVLCMKYAPLFCSLSNFKYSKLNIHLLESWVWITVSSAFTKNKCEGIQFSCSAAAFHTVHSRPWKKAEDGSCGKINREAFPLYRALLNMLSYDSTFFLHFPRKTMKTFEIFYLKIDGKHKKMKKITHKAVTKQFLLLTSNNKWLQLQRFFIDHHKWYVLFFHYQQRAS